MKNLKSKIRDFLNSEEGRVGVKTPLTLGMTAGGILLAHAVTAPKANAFDTCSNDADCRPGETCESRRFKVFGEYWDPTRQAWIPYSTWEWHDVCV